MARVVNIARTLDELKAKNVWVVGLDERGEKSYDELDYNMNCAIVMGAEGKGLHDLVRRKCDMLVSIPMMGAVSSLNVSVAGGIVMYEVQRQRRQAQKAAARRNPPRSGKRSSLAPSCARRSVLCAPGAAGNGAGPQRLHLHPLRSAGHGSIPTSTGWRSKARWSCATSRGNRSVEAVLQISSSLHWLSVLADGEEVEWLEQTYTSDIDHTGALNEAIVKFDKPLAPGESLRLKVRYSGTVQKDTTRLERIGTPADVARRSDWDEISDSFTALRGAGFVVWYPVSMDAANLGQGNELFEILRDWREREASALLRVHLSRAAGPEGDAVQVHLCGQWLGSHGGHGDHGRVSWQSIR